MRLRLRFDVLKKPAIIPINYQYEISSSIYHILSEGNQKYATWLHEQGYKSGNRYFKNFTFSGLNISKFKVIRDRLQIQSDQIELIISFAINPALENFIKGLFQKQCISLGDKRSKVNLRVSFIETLSEPEFKESMTFRAISPICVSHYTGSKYPVYLNPNSDHYQEFLIKNLLAKYNSIKPAMKENSIVQSIATGEFSFNVVNKERVKSRLIKIKANTPQESKVRGFQFTFTISAPVFLLKIGYQAGFGEKNSLGFGCVEYSG